MIVSIDLLFFIKFDFFLVTVESLILLRKTYRMFSEVSNSTQSKLDDEHSFINVNASFFSIRIVS